MEQKTVNRIPPHPCKKECPKRGMLCQSDCPEWKEYRKARDAEYDRRGREKDVCWSYAHEMSAKVRKATGWRIIHRHG